MSYFPIGKLPKPQKVFQFFERDCGVAVFAELSGISVGDILADLPTAHLGTVSVDGWKAWLESKGFTVRQEDGAPDDIVPCAHLVGLNNPRSNSDFHWIYRDEDGDVHDPSPVFTAMSADDSRMRSVSFFYSQRVLTLSVSKAS